MIEAFLETQQTKIQEYDEDLVRKLLHRVTVYDDHLHFAPPGGHRCVCQRTLGGGSGQRFNQLLSVQ